MNKNKYALYLSGLINEMEEVEEMPGAEHDNVDPQMLNQLLNKISMRLGEKSSTYRPLINFLKSKPSMLELFDHLLDSVGDMKPSTYDQIDKQFDH